MKQFYKLFCLFLVITIFTTPLSAQIQNGDFELWQGNSLDAWTTVDTGISLSKSTSTIKEGNSAAGVIVNTSTQGSTDLRQTITVVPNQSYDFSVWVYHTEGGVKARLYVNGYRNYSVSSIVNQWQQISYNYTPTSSSIEVGLRFYDVSGFDGSETVYVDDYQPSESSSGGGGSGCQETEVILTLNTDNYASETSWELKSANGSVLDTGSGYSNNTTITKDFCLSGGDYEFVIYDSYGDGICCSYGNGSYSLSSASTTYASGGDFSSSDNTTFTIGTSGGGGTGGYYDGTAGLSGYSLKTALYNIIKDHSNQGYNSLWDFYENNELDQYYENDGTILDIYSEKPNSSDSYNYTKVTDQCGNYSGEGFCYNREHSFPRSWFGGAVEPMNSDIHHIFATDGYVNGRRNSYPFGEVSSATFSSTNGSRLGSAISGLGYSGTVFEPIDEFKGDLARAYFYMATRYQNVISNWENNNSNVNAVLDGSSNHVFENWALAMLIDWHTNDPVSQKEVDRNAAAFNYQGNRNPFVDHPEFVAQVWENSNFRSTSTTTSSQANQLTSEDFIVNYVNNTLTIKSRVAVRAINVYDISGRTILEKNVVIKANENTAYSVHLKSNTLYILKIQGEGISFSNLLMVND